MKTRIKKSLIILIIGLVINIALALTKLYVGLSSNSLCIMLDATNNLLDCCTCIVTAIAFIIILKPKSETAPYGYGRSEYLAGFIVAVVSIITGVLFFVKSLNRISMPEPIWFGWQNCVLISVAVPIKLGLGLFYYFENRKIKSKALKALMLDSFLDTGITATSLIAFTISSKIDYAVDSIFGMVMSIVVIVFAVKMVIDNIKAVVVGDGAEEEKTCINSILSSAKTITVKGQYFLHDYGYATKTGVVYVTKNDGVIEEEAKAEIGELEARIFDECGAEVKLIIKSL